MPTVMLTRHSSYKLPISKKTVKKGERVSIPVFEWEQLKSRGAFVEVPDEVADDMGLDVVTDGKQPDMHLPPDWSHKKIVIRITGGVGDAIMCAGLARVLKSKPCHVAMCVQSNQVKLINAFAGVDECFETNHLNEPQNLYSYDVLLDMSYTFVDSQQTIKDEPYYDLIKKKANIPLPVNPGKLMLDKDMLNRVRKRMPYKPIVAIHAGSSNPIRRWDIEKWRTLAYRLLEHNCSILWLGNSSDFGFEDTNVIHAGNVSTELLDQAGMLWQCDYFIGNDSAFAHVAGVMGIPGLVLFSATEPSHVIGKYDTLKPIQVFDDLGVKPSRSCKNQDESANACMKSISVDKVFGSIDKRILNHPVRRKANGIAKSAYVDRTVRRVPLNKRSRILAVFPHLIMGGGERMMATLYRNLGTWFDIDAVGLHQGRAVLNSPKLKEVVEESINGKLRVFDQPQELSDLQNLIASEDYDVVMYYGWSNEVPNVLSKLNRCPATVRVCHTSSDQEMQAIEHVRAQIDSLICVAKEPATRLGGEWIPNAVDRSRFTTNEVADIKFDNDFPVLGYIGRMDGLKGLQTVIEFQKKMDFNLILVGMGDTSDDRFFQRLVRENGVSDRVKMFGITDDVEKFYRRMDAYVLLSDSEGMPLGVLEAAYCGKPSVVTPVGVIPSIFAHGSNVILCNKKEENFREALALVQTSAREIGEKARELVANNYTDDTQALLYRKAIRKAMGLTYPEPIRKGTIRLKRKDGAGDVIMATSVIAKAVDMFPDAKLQFQTPMVDLVKNDPRLTEVAEEFSTTPELEVDIGYYDCWKRGESALDAMGGSADEVKLFFPQDQLDASKEVAFPSPSVGFWMYQNPRSIYKTKEWPHENWTTLFTRLKERGINCYQLGAKFESQHGLLLDARCESITESLLRLAACDLVCSIDCVAQHAANALGKSSVVIWGGSATPDLVGYPNQINVVTEDEHRCIAALCASTFKQESCCKDMSCMGGVSVDRVYDAIIKELERLNAITG